MKEKLEHFKNLGYTYDPETGIIKNKLGKIIYNKNNKGYLRLCSSINNKQIHIKQHHFAWFMYYNEAPNLIRYHIEIDHINRIKNDNRICNLRIVNRSQNINNSDKIELSTGTSFVKNMNKYRSQISINGKKIHLGYYIRQEDAHQAYIDAKNKL